MAADDRWRALGLGRQPAPGPRVPEWSEEAQEGFLGRLGSLLGTDQPSLASRMQEQGQRQRTRLPDGTAADPPLPGTPEFDAAVDVAGAFDFLGPIKAYHGSPHTFDAFSLGRIGTGEGAQAYGHGLYFAENPAVAKEYQRDLEGIGARLLSSGGVDKPWKDLNDVEKHAFREVLDTGGSFDEAIKGLEDIQANPQNYPAGEGTRKMWADALPVLRQWKEQGATITPGGNQYTVNLDVNHDDLLDWDAPLSQQPEKVRKALEGLGVAATENPAKLEKLRGKLSELQAQADRAANPDPIFRQIDKVKDRIAAVGGASGKDVYWRFGDNVAAAEKLRAAGIPGIRYLDQGSRAGGEGTRNFVLFDDALAEILERNGQPVPRK